MMKKVLLALAASLAVTPAWADYSWTPGSGATVKAGGTGTTIQPWSTIVDSSGNPLGTVSAPWIGGYAQLALMRRPGETYSDVILRLVEAERRGK